jgi:GDP-L-fucose synthase
VGYSGEIEWDTSKPNGTHRKVLDTTKISNLGWKPEVSLFDGINQTYKWYLNELKISNNN